MSDGMGGHQSHAMGKDEWLTPPPILAALGAFDLDPCSPIRRPWDTARQHFTALDDGLSKPWHGRVWCNPPYGAMATRWLARLADHGNGIALVFARTETAAWVEHVWAKAHAVLFIAGRLHFHHVDGTRAPANSGAPSALIAYGENNAEDLRTCGIEGAFVPLPRGVKGPGVTIYLTRDPETGEVLRGDPPGVTAVQAPHTEALQWAVKALRFLMPGTPVGPHAEFEKAVAALGVMGTQGGER